MMNLWLHIRLLFARLRQRVVTFILAHRVQYHNPTLRSHRTAIWDYGFSHLDAIRLGHGVVVQPYCEIIVYKHTRHSRVEGRLELGDGVIVSTGCNLRAAGGTIRVGAGSCISQHCVVVAAHHRIDAGLPYVRSPWDDTRSGVSIGRNVWIGAGCIILSGTVIGDHAVIASGAVVRGTVPANELWGGVPARFIKSLPEQEPTAS